MDKTAKFSLIEVSEASGVEISTLRKRFYTLKRTGRIPAGSTATAMTYEDAKQLLAYRQRRRMTNREDAKAILRQQLKTDGFL